MTERHKEDKLNGVVEAALNHCMLDERWLRVVGEDPEIEQNTATEVFQALENYICDHLARIT